MLEQNILFQKLLQRRVKIDDCLGLPPPVTFARIELIDVRHFVGTQRGGDLFGVLGDDHFIIDALHLQLLNLCVTSFPHWGNATIQTATLRIKKWSQVGGDPLADSHLHVDIASAPGRFGTGYALQNMYFEATPGGDTIAYVPSGTTPDANGWFSTNLNPTGRSLISLTNKTQLRLRFGQADNGNNIADYIKFVSGNSTGGSPELIISYTSPAGTPSKTPIASPSGTVTATPTLTPTATSTPAPLTASNASFTYDGDGKMVKSIMDGVTTIIVSPIYQVKMNAGNSGPGVITKYYPGGAMRVGGALYYTLSDHLGSTSLTTDANGNKIAEMRYKPWGEVRYKYGDSQTDRTYTGQRSYSSDFGLMFYNARWYDPAIGRFAQADTVVPSEVQGYDRYAYVNNSPVNYADPTGHYCVTYINGNQCIEDDGPPSPVAQSSNVPLPGKPQFTSLPIDPKDIKGVQWFGGTKNSHLLMASSNIYKYCHYFHCGLDILADWGSQVSAGVYGKVLYAGCANANFEGPCKVQIQVGDYVVEYGHLNDIPLVERNESVMPSTIIGGVGSNSHSDSNPDFPDKNKNFTHIHLEVRGGGN